LQTPLGVVCSWPRQIRRAWDPSRDEDQTE
jgi:hypothetical protein